MPVSPLKKDEMEHRRQIEQHLFESGLTFQDVAFALNLDASAVRNDFDKLGGRERFPLPELGTSERRDWAFGNALKLLHKTRRPGFAEEVRDDLRAALKKYADYRRLLGIAEGLASAVIALANPDDPWEYRPYRELLRDIFCSQRLEFSGENLLNYYLEYLCIPGINPPGRKALPGAMGKWALAEYEDHYTVAFDGSVANAFDKAFGLIDVRYGKLLRMRYGLGCAEVTLEKIASELGLDVVPERIRQIEAKALRSLRHPERSVILMPFVTPLHKAVRRQLAERYPDPPAQPPPPAEELRMTMGELLDLSVEELDLSVRSYNCLKNANIKTVGDMVVRTESEMLRMSNFGRKSLNEMKEVLRNLGLSFGMQLDERGLLIEATRESEE